MPTLLALLGLPVPEDLDGRDLSAVFAGGPCPSAPMFAESIQGGFQAREESARTFLWAVRDGRHKLIVTRAPHSERIELYDLDADPGEQVDLVSERPEVVERLAALLDGLVERSGGPGYWRGRLADKEPDPKAAREVLAAPRILAPAVGSALEFEASGAAIAGHWTGSPAATYVVEYDVGEGANRTQGTFEVEGNRYEFGPVPREVWRNLSQFNPWRLRLWPQRAPDKKSPWAEFTVVDPGAS